MKLLINSIIIASRCLFLPILFPHLWQLVLGDCGKPGLPPNVELIGVVFNDTYEENAVISHHCENGLDQLIGDRNRTCRYTRWHGQIPRCARNMENSVRLAQLQLFDAGKMRFERRFILDSPYAYSSSNWPELCVQIKPLSIGSSTITLTFDRSSDISFFKLTLHSQSLIQLMQSDAKTHVHSLEDVVDTNHSIAIKASTEAHDCSLNYQNFAQTFVTLGFLCEKFEDVDDNEEHGSKGVLLSAQESSNPFESVIEMTRVINISFLFNHGNKHHVLKDVSLCEVQLFKFDAQCGTVDEIPHMIRSTRRPFTLFSCVDGYELIGETHVRCSSNGKWLGKFPFCIEKRFCDLPAIDVIRDDKNKTIINVSYKPSSTVHAFTGTLAIFNCENITIEGKKTKLSTGSSAAVKVCHRGRWTGDNPKCILDDGPSESASALIRPFSTVVIIMSIILFICITVLAVIFIKWYIKHKRLQRRLRKTRMVIPTTKVTDYDDEEESGGEKDYDVVRMSGASNTTNSMYDQMQFYEDIEEENEEENDGDRTPDSGLSSYNHLLGNRDHIDPDSESQCQMRINSIYSSVSVK